MNRIALLVGLIIIYSCNQKEPVEEDFQLTKPALGDKDSYHVKTVTVKQEILSYPILAQGKIEAQEFTPITFEVSGILKFLHVSNASYIRKGQIIASLQNDLQEIDVKEANQNFKKVKVDFESSLASFGDSLSNPDHWSVIKENVALLSGLSSAELALERATISLEKTAVYAPFSGFVEGLKIREGESVTGMQPIGRIVNQNSLEVNCNILEFDLGKLSLGDSAAIYPLAYPGKQLLAQVHEINPKVEETGYVRVRLALKQEHRLIEGMSVRVEIFVPESRQLLVPKSAVVRKSGRNVVFTVEDSLAKWNYVTIGKDNGKQIEILDGLEPDVEVIVSNNLQLAHDSPVHVGTLDPS